MTTTTSTGPSIVRTTLAMVTDNAAGSVETLDQPDPIPTLEERLRARMVSGLDLCALPPPTWIVDGIIPAPGVGLLYGAPKAGKSFVGMDLACCIATGRPWLGRDTRQGRVLYIVAEGVGGFGQRLNAWADYHGADGLDRITWLPHAVNLTSPDTVAALCDIVPGYDLVVFDTLARCAVGLEENSAKDMGELVANVDRIRDACGGHVLLVHHAGKDATQKARGSSALLGAADVSLKVTGGDYVTVTVEDAKDAEGGHSIRYTREPVGSSLVLVEGGAPDRKRPPKGMDTALDCLLSIAGPGGVSFSQWKDDSVEQGVAAGSFARIRKWLEDTGQVVNVGTQKQPRYAPITDPDRLIPTDPPF